MFRPAAALPGESRALAESVNVVLLSEKGSASVNNGRQVRAGTASDGIRL